VTTQARARIGFLAIALLLPAPSAVRAQNKLPPPPRAPKHPALSNKIMLAKSVYFDNETGDSAVGRDTLRELAEWGRFRVVGKSDAQLVMVLSTEEFTDDEFAPASGGLDVSTLHLPRKPLNAFLTIIDKSTGDRVWIDSRPWGGVLTGANSAGRRLIARLRKTIEHQHPPE
jgi:hypothetical protein